jgi:hypothetical protein
VLYTAGLINAALNASGVYAANIGGKLTLYADSTAANDGSTEGTGVIAINNVSGTPLATLGITSWSICCSCLFSMVPIIKHQDGAAQTHNQNPLAACSNRPML